MAPVTFVTLSRIVWILKNKFEPHVQGKAVFTVTSEGKWSISIVDKSASELIIGENEHELDIILDKFQKNQLEVKNDKVEKVKQTPEKSRLRRQESDSLHFNDSDNIVDYSDFFD